MIDPMVWKATCDLIAIEDSAVTRYAADSSSAAIKPEQRATASVKLAYHRNRREAFLKISETPQDFITVATQPLQRSTILDALGVTAQLIPRDDNDREVSRRCASLGWTYDSDRPKGLRHSSADARAAMSVAQRLLRTPTPPAASVLRPTGSITEVKLVPPTKLAENRITVDVAKTKLHILACDQPWGYDAIAASNACNTDQATYTTPHALDANVAAVWSTAFRTASAAAGTPVDVVIHGPRRPVRGRHPAGFHQPGRARLFGGRHHCRHERRGGQGGRC